MSFVERRCMSQISYQFSIGTKPLKIQGTCRPHLTRKDPLLNCDQAVLARKEELAKLDHFSVLGPPQLLSTVRRTAAREEKDSTFCPMRDSRVAHAQGAILFV